MLDLTGKRFGKLTVLEQIGHNKNRSVVWCCVCDCGRHKNVSSQRLVNGTTKSCNCLKGQYKVIPDGESAFNSLYAAYKRKAAHREIAFSLTQDHFRLLTSNNCVYCGVEPIRKHYANKKAGYYTCNGVDRIDSNKGYEIDNCVSCCYRCNTMKSNMTKNDFLAHIKRIYECQNTL